MEQTIEKGRAIPDIPLAKHINHTPFPSQYFQTVDQYGEVFHVIATRITYDMTQLWGDGYLSYAEEQTPLAMSDVWDGEINESSPLWESDFAPYKPKCDVLVVNAVTRPAERSVSTPLADSEKATRWACGLALQWSTPEQTINTWHKQLIATGPRSYGLLGSSEPTAAHEVRIHWQNAYGGQDPATDPNEQQHIDWRNPVGAGIDQRRGQRAPQLEASANQPYRGQKNYPPVSLNALGKVWLPRRTLAGTYDQHWLDTQWPLPPMDFDYGYWNCAPADQQISYLPPGTKLDLVSLYPPNIETDWPKHFTAKIPLHQLFIYVYDSIAPASGININFDLDTFVIDMDKLQVYITHRIVLPAVDHSTQHSLVMETRMAPVGNMNESIETNELGPLG